MSNALIVKLTNTFAELNPGALGPTNSVLRRATCGWWTPRNPERAAAIRFIVGVHDDKVLSIYPVPAVPPEDWPRLDARAVDGRGEHGRQFVPSSKADLSLWSALVGQTLELPHRAVVRYGAVRTSKGTAEVRVGDIPFDDDEDQEHG
jgi:hypothetical protein